MKFTDWRRRRAGVAAAAAAAIALAVAGLCASRDRGTDAALPTTLVKRGDLPIEIAAVGEVQAVRSITFGVPRIKSRDAKLTWLVPEGSTVAPGDTLARFDTSEIARRIEDLEGQLTSARASLAKVEVEQAARRAEMQAQVEDQRAALRLAELAAENVQYEARVEQEKSQLNLQRARLALQQAESKIVTQQASDAAAMTEQRVKIQALENGLTGEREAFRNHVLVATAGGLAVYGSQWNAGRMVKIKVGDALYFGGTVLELPDLSDMQVTSYVNEGRVQSLRVGLACDVHVDALPDTTFGGTVSRINVLGRELPESEGVKVFDFEIRLAGRDPRLRPGMTANVVVHVDVLHDVLFAPIETVHSDSAGAYVLRRGRRRFERTPVAVGAQNDFLVAFTSGVRQGDVLALRAAPPAPGRGD